MVMYANEFKTKEKQNLTENKKLTATYIYIIYIYIYILVEKKKDFKIWISGLEPTHNRKSKMADL